MIQSLAQAKRCYDEGRFQESTFRKVPAIASTAGVWSDLSGAPGNPKPNYYVGAELTATALDGTYGLYHGGNVSPYTKYLHKILIGSVSAGHAPATYSLLDYLLFYPLVDMDSTDEQFMVNTVTLPRYTDGTGVEAMLIATNPYIGGAFFNINYTGACGSQLSSFMELSNSTTLIGSAVTSGTPTLTGGGGLFFKRITGCFGIRRVNSITFFAPNGGLAALVLVKPLATLMTNEITAYCEYDFITQKKTLPIIQDGAYLNFVGCSGSSWAAAPINGSITTIWG